MGENWKIAEVYGISVFWQLTNVRRAKRSPWLEYSFSRIGFRLERKLENADSSDRESTVDATS